MVSAPRPNPQDSYRDDIQGVRAIGAILITVYHIWIHKVSGGVDVFFVISGFLMTGVLIRQLESMHRIQPWVFWGNLVKRIAPSACTVLLATLLLGYFFVPEPLWTQFIEEVTYSAIHIENIGLMLDSVDYLAREQPPSPVQQFWALSIQVQFYFFLPLILALVLGLSKGFHSTRPFIAAIAAIIAASFLYSVAETASNPASAYFNPLARAWEFFTGALLAFLLPYLNLNAALRNILGLVGLLALLLCGILVSESIKFPGSIALIPVTAAALLIVSGAGSTQTTVKRLLSSPWLTALGKVSFGIYLWHWPLLAFTIEYTGSNRLSLPLGLAIILLAIVLAMATNRYIEEPIRQKRYQPGKAWAPYLIGGAFLAPVLATAATWNYYIQNTIASQIHYKLQQASIDDATRLDERQDTSQIPRGEMVAVKELLPDSYADNCHQDITSPQVQICTYGDLRSQASIALVGGSHATQWLPALDSIGKQQRLKIFNITKSACPLGALPDSDPSCVEWNRQLLEDLSRLKPLAVITNSTRAALPASPEHVPPSYVQQWQKLESLGIQVIAIRDNPSFDFDAAACIARHKNGALACAKPREQSLSNIDPSVTHLSTLRNLSLIDMSEFFCTQRTCITITNDHLMYRDAEHLNVLYVLSLTDELHKKLTRASPDIFPPALIAPQRQSQTKN